VYKGGLRGGSFNITSEEFVEKKHGFLILEAALLKLFIFFKNHFVNFIFISSKLKNLEISLINVESIKRFQVTADIISILIHNNNLQFFV